MIEQDELHDVKEFLEEFSGEGQHQAETSLGAEGKGDSNVPPSPEVLERQLTSLQEEVREVKDLLEHFVGER